jgi:hypothetical protein
MQFKVSKQNSPEERPRVPDWIREFSYPDWTSVFQLVPSNDHLYGTETLFGDWNARVLLLLKDGCPTNVIQERRDSGESRPWRHGERARGDKIGVQTNERLCRFVPLISEKRLLYGSTAANMLFDTRGASRRLAGFNSGPLHEFLREVLCWVLKSMPQVEWVACLGKEAWFLTCIAIGNPNAASMFRQHIDSHKPVFGNVGKKKIAAFPLHHPSRVGYETAGKEWRALAAVLSVPNAAAVAHEFSPRQATSSLSSDSTKPETTRTPKNYDARKSAPKHRPIITATLLRRHCRVQFVVDKNVVHTSPEYNSGNTWANIIAYARRKRGGAPANLSRAATAIPQVLTSGGWINFSE